jgi:hypothetical protein
VVEVNSLENRSSREATVRPRNLRIYATLTLFLNEGFVKFIRQTAYKYVPYRQMNGNRAGAFLMSVNTAKIPIYWVLKLELCKKRNFRI